jgi:hypothetical protein
MADTKTLGAVALLSLTLSIACTPLQLRMREPGEELETFPEPVAAEYHCDKRPLPFVQVELNELLPQRVRAGQEFAHRTVYVMCPAQPTQVLPGKLTTRILHRGNAIFQEQIDYEVKPGRWVVDTRIPLPAEAAPGIYALEVNFANPKATFETRATFSVEAP